jgi:hypothetical protein
MASEVGSIWPLTVIVPPKDTALQKSLSVDLPSQNPGDSVVLDNPVVLESEGSWEKGTFVDLYI